MAYYSFKLIRSVISSYFNTVILLFIFSVNTFFLNKQMCQVFPVQLHTTSFREKKNVKYFFYIHFNF